MAADSGLMSLPVPVSVGLKVDQPPRITMAYSGVRQRITPQAHIPLSIDARDDYGLAAVGLTIKDETPDPADPAKLVAHSTRESIYPEVRSSKSEIRNGTSPKKIRCRCNCSRSKRLTWPSKNCSPARSSRSRPRPPTIATPARKRADREPSCSASFRRKNCSARFCCGSKPSESNSASKPKRPGRSAA